MNVQEAKERAEKVINGFTTPKLQQARDVIKLADLLEVRNKQVERLAAELQKHKTGDDFLSRIFGGTP